MNLFGVYSRMLEPTPSTRVSQQDLQDPDFLVSKQLLRESMQKTIMRLFSETVKNYKCEMIDGYKPFYDTNLNKYLREISSIVAGYLEVDEYVDQRIHPDMAGHELVYLSPNCESWEDAEDLIFVEQHEGDESIERNARAIHFVSKIDKRPLTLFVESRQALHPSPDPINDIIRKCAYLPMETPVFGWDLDSRECFDVMDKAEQSASALSLRIYDLGGKILARAEKCGGALKLVEKAYGTALEELRLEFSKGFPQGNGEQLVNAVNAKKKAFDQLQKIGEELMDEYDITLALQPELRLNFLKFKTKIYRKVFPIRTKIFTHCFSNRRTVAPNGIRIWEGGIAHFDPTWETNPLCELSDPFQVFHSSKVAIFAPLCLRTQRLTSVPT
jgi:hypothetical protein